MPKTIFPRVGAGRLAAVWFGCVVSVLGFRSAAPATGLDDYVAKPDGSFSWKETGSVESNGFTIVQLELVSQQWREHVWKHQMQVVRPPKVRNPDIGFLYVTGGSSGRREVGLLTVLAERAGAVAAVVGKVPNQPLYEGRNEDALIAYTFEQFSKSGDPTWPLLLPMVKSAVRAMDAVQALGKSKWQQEVSRFVVGGASKRGWTTWLSGAVDKRVVAIAPMVIDMLNMKQQIDWAAKVYGKQSEQIQDYTDLNLHLRQDEPRIVELRNTVDPYAYRERFTMPKLILLGTNDRYWTVDSLRHYWNDLPEPKLIYQTPNAGHDLGGGAEATQTLAAFYQMIADRQALPKMTWKFQDTGQGTVQAQVSVSQNAQSINLWTAQSSDRDFRDDRWESRPLKIAGGSSRAEAAVPTPETGYQAFMAEVMLKSSTGHSYKLSTEARVTPDGVRGQ